MTLARSIAAVYSECEPVRCISTTRALFHNRESSSIMALNQNTPASAKKQTSSKPATKRTPIQPSFQAPPWMSLTPDEIANCTRLIAVLRERDYWVGAFIEWMLQEERSGITTTGMTTDAAIKMLNEIKALGSWVDWMENNPVSRSPIKRYFAARFFPDAATDSITDMRECITHNSDREFAELIEEWRKQYPEPQKKSSSPAGKPDCVGADEA